MKIRTKPSEQMVTNWRADLTAPACKSQRVFYSGRSLVFGAPWLLLAAHRKDPVLSDFPIHQEILDHELDPHVIAN